MVAAAILWIAFPPVRAVLKLVGMFCAKSVSSPFVRVVWGKSRGSMCCGAAAMAQETPTFVLAVGWFDCVAATGTGGAHEALGWPACPVL